METNNIKFDGLIKKMLKEHKLEGGLDLIHIKNIWKSEMGPGVASYTKEIVFDKGALTVSLSSSVLREELSYGLEKIIILLNERLEKPLIKKIRLK